MQALNGWLKAICADGLVLVRTRVAGPWGFASRRRYDSQAAGVTDAEGNGIVTESRLYQLVRQFGRVKESTFEICFLDAGVGAFAFTFG